MSCIQSTINHQLLNHAKKEIEFLSSDKHGYFFSDDEAVARLTLAITDQGASRSWELASGLFNGDTQKGHYFLFWAIKNALDYDEGSTLTPKAVKEWKSETIAALKKVERLLLRTPDEYLHYSTDYSKAREVEITKHTDGMTIDSDILFKLEVMSMYGEDAKLQREALEKATYKRTSSPLKTKGVLAKRTYFIRSMSRKLNIMTDDCVEIIYPLTKTIFGKDIKRKQIVELMQDIGTNPHNRINEKVFEQLIYPRLLAKDFKN
jgi:hypothetical protein